MQGLSYQECLNFKFVISQLIDELTTDEIKSCNSINDFVKMQRFSKFVDLLTQRMEKFSVVANELKNLGLDYSYQSRICEEYACEISYFLSQAYKRSE